MLYSTYCQFGGHLVPLLHCQCAQVHNTDKGRNDDGRMKKCAKKLNCSAATTQNGYKKKHEKL
jgi:hypothetical protein